MEETHQEEFKSIGEYQVVGLITTNSRFQIYQVTKNNENYAIKIYISHDEELDQKTKEEIHALSTIKSEYVVKMIEHFVWEGKICLVLEFLRGGNLVEYMSVLPGKRIPEKKVLSIIKQVVMGLQTMHEHDTIHRNIKLENVIYTTEVHEGVKIAGFTHSQELKEDEFAFKLYGTLAYTSPEILLGNPYTYKIDIWALGVMIWTMLFGKFPFGYSKDSEVQLREILKICRGDQFHFEEIVATYEDYSDIIVSSDLMSLFQKMFQLNYENRISFAELLQHPLIRSSQKVNGNLDIYQRTFPNLKRKLGTIVLDEGEAETLNERFQAKYAPTQPSSQKNTSQIILQKNNATWKTTLDFQEHTNKYYFATLRYNLLIDTYLFLKSNRSWLLLSSVQDQTLASYFLLRTALYYLKRDRFALVNQENVFKLTSFEFFLQTEQYKQMIAQNEVDLKKWTAEFSQVYEEALQYKPDLKPEIKDSIDIKVPTDQSFNYMKLPDEYKLPLRAVCLTLYSKSYNSAQKVLKGEEKNPPTLTGKNFSDVQKWQKAESIHRTQSALRLLMCSIINKIIDLNNLVINLNLNLKNEKITEKDLVNWLHRFESEKEPKLTSFSQLENIKNMFEHFLQHHRHEDHFDLI